jgi:voltage-gated potassium channel
MRFFDNGAAVVDIVVIASLFASALSANLGFRRIVRTLRLLRTYNVLVLLCHKVSILRCSLAARAPR